MIDLKKHYVTTAERFLQTAIVIDDQAMFGEISEVPSQVVTPANSLLAAAKAGSPLPSTVMTQSGPPSSSLNAKVLTEAFLSLKMICGLYRPSPGENMVERTIGAAEAADVVVVDWHLEQGSSRPAKDIVLGLLRADHAEKGRLRLIAIYTAQAGRQEIAKDLLTEITLQHPELAGSLERDGAVLRSPATRIVVLNKRNTPEGADWEQVTEEDLPNRLVSEFAELSQGVLASFALASVDAVRRGAHHVLALYTTELEGAFIAHRCGIPNPDDAKTFALDLISSELRNLIEIENVAEATLGTPLITAWIESKHKEGHRFQSETAEVPVECVKNFVSGGSEAVKSSASSQHKPGQPSEKAKARDSVNSGSLARVFYPRADLAVAGVRKLSRLSTFQREPGRTRLPEAWRPLLTLGSVVQKCLQGRAGELLLCVQPRCDSVRLLTPTTFPFQTIKLTETSEDFNLILADLEGVAREAWVNLKPRDTRMIEFAPTPESKAVFGQRQTDSDRFIFCDSSGVNYFWLGDLKDMKAQRWAGELGSRVQSVGLEEFELLRLAGERKLKLDWA